MKKYSYAILLAAAFLLVACGSSTTTIPTQTPIKPAPTPTRMPAPTRQTSPASYLVCNEKVTNAPCVQYASIQDAAVGESQVGAIVHTSISNGVVSVSEDITNVAPSPLGPDNTLDAIQYQCFNIQQGLWYGLKSTINADGSQTIRKSAFSEVDITFIDHHKGDAVFASCSLTSAGVDKIDQAGMWSDGDYVGAWSLYNSTSFA